MRTFIYAFVVASFLMSCAKTSETGHLSDATNVIDKKYPEATYFQLRNYPDETFNKKAFLKATTQVKETINQRSDGQWLTQGPGNISGRVSSIDIDQEGNIYLCYSKGGVYKSSDNGQSYESLMDDEAFLAVSDIAIDPTNTDILYVASGDVDISIMFGIGNGVLKSTDGGQSWENKGLMEESIISRIHVDKNNPNLVFASAMGIPGKKNNKRGIYRSENGGDDWEQILFVNDSTGIQDMIVHPDNPDIIYATGWNRIRNNRRSVVAGPDARIYKTTDGGTNWSSLTNNLPEGDFSRVGLAMSGSNPEVIFANFASAGNFLSLHKSVDGGENWTTITEAGENGYPENTHGGFAWFFGQMAVNPNDDDDIFLLGVQAYRTLDGGQSWEDVTAGHVDNHHVLFHENDIYIGTDGGAYRSNVNNVNWEDIDFNVTGMLYKVGYNPHLPDLYYGGAQDNGTYRGNGENINDWEVYGFGDGFQPAFHPTNDEIIFAESQNGFIYMLNSVTGNFLGLTDGLEGPFYWDTPYLISPHFPNQIITASNRVYSIVYDEINFDIVEQVELSDNLTEPNSNWQAHSISSVDQSPFDPNILFAGTTDGLVWRSLNYGDSWEQIMTGLPRRYVSKIVASTDDINTVYVTFTGYRDDEYIPHVFASNDQGDYWQDISSNLPNFAVNDIMAYPFSEDRILFVATDGGVYFTENADEEAISWDRLGDNMPIIPIWDLAYNVVNNQLVAGSFARGILSFDLEQVDIEETVSTENELSNTFTVYPTVAKDLVYFKHLPQGVDKIQMVNASGVKSNYAIHSASKSLDITNLHSGIYFVQCRDKSNRLLAASKIIKH